MSGEAGRRLRAESNEDWRVGDLAECVTEGFYPPMPYDPVRGDVLRVRAVIVGLVGFGGTPVVALAFERKPQGIAWHCMAFRKIRPTIEPAAEDFCAWLRGEIAPLGADRGRKVSG